MKINKLLNKLVTMDIRVANKYRLTKKLGHGAFGDIFEGVNLKSGENVAIKLE